MCAWTKTKDCSTEGVISGFILGLAVAALFVVATSTPGRALTDQPKKLTCDVGPIAKTFGGTQWLVYSCDDQRTVVIVSATGSPAMPFVFTFFPDKNGYRLTGEGNGQKHATAAAFEELKTLSARDVSALIEQTKQP